VPAFLPGDEFGPYRLERQLGAGGFAQVWLATEAGLEGFRKRVALKLLVAAGEASAKQRAALVNEARLGGNLHHPNLVDVHRIAEANGTWYIAMEYIDGVDLRRLLGQVARLGLRLPHSLVLEIGAGVAAGLDYAHRATDHGGKPLRLVHRDLKPANVLLGRAGAIKVVDFGIAKAATNVAATATAAIKGTPTYVAPEVWAGQKAHDPRIDLFGLGCLLFEMTMGYRLIREGPTPAIAAQALFGRVEDELAIIKPKFPELVPLLGNLLQRKPALRTPDARTALDVLEELRRADPEHGRAGDYLALLQVARMRPHARAKHRDGLRPPQTEDLAWSTLIDLAMSDVDALAPVDLRLADARGSLNDLGDADAGRVDELEARWTVTSARPDPAAVEAAARTAIPKGLTRPATAADHKLRTPEEIASARVPRPSSARPADAPKRKKRKKKPPPGPSSAQALILMLVGFVVIWLTIDGARILSDRAAVEQMIDEGILGSEVGASLPALLTRLLAERELDDQVRMKRCYLSGHTDRFEVVIEIQDTVLGLPIAWTVRRAGPFDAHRRADDLEYYRQSGWTLDAGADFRRIESKWHSDEAAATGQP